MIVPKDFLNRLKDFGLNSYEANLWTALLSRGVATAGELSDIANVPRSRSYDVLESLERKGFVIMKLGKPIKYIAVPPQEVIERVKKTIEEGAKRQSKIIEGLKESKVLSELNSLFTEGIKTVEPVDLTGFVKGRPNLYNHIGVALKNAKKSVLIMTSASGAKRKTEELKNALQKAKTRGVSVKFIVSKGVSKKLPSTIQVKQVDKIPARFCVVDSKQVTFMVLDDDKVHPNYDFGVTVSTPQFAKGFENIFNMIWDKK